MKEIKGPICPKCRGNLHGIKILEDLDHQKMDYECDDCGYRVIINLQTWEVLAFQPIKNEAEEHVQAK